MDSVLVILGFVVMFIGILGSLLPVLPGPPLSWVGLLLLYLTQAVPTHWGILGTTLALALFVTVMDYVIPAIGTKKFGGSKAGVWGTVVGLVLAIIFPVLGALGIIIWPFVGALVGELLHKANRKMAFKAAFGSFLGFLASTFIKLVVSVLYAVFYVYITIKYGGDIFSSS